MADRYPQTLSNKYRRQLLDRFLSQDIQFFDRAENTTGALTSRLDTYPQSVLELMGFNIALIGVAMINVIACSALALAYAWRLGLVIVLAGLPPLVLSGWIRIRLETKMDRDTSKRYSTSASIASEAVNAIRTVSSLAIESAILKKYTEELDYAVTKTVRSTCIMMVSFALTQSIEYFFLAVGFWYVTLTRSGECLTDIKSKVWLSTCLLWRCLHVPIFHCFHGCLLRWPVGRSTL